MKKIFIILIFLQTVYCEENGINKNLLLSCDKGEDNACFKIGEKYARGNNVDKNYEIAIKYFIKSCNLGNIEASYKLGIIYVMGRKNRKKAVKFYTIACDSNHGKACNNLGALYKYGKYGVTKDYKKALELFDKACKSEDGVEKGCTNKEELEELIKANK